MVDWASIHREMQERTELLQRSLEAQSFIREREDHSTFNISDDEWSLTFNIWAKRLPAQKLRLESPAA